jgi:hypothetical protein
LEVRKIDKKINNALLGSNSASAATNTAGNSDQGTYCGYLSRNVPEE